MMILLAAVLDAPLVGVLARWPHTFHAVEMEAVLDGWERTTFASACGMRGLRLCGTEYEGELISVPWPPRSRGLPAPYSRCRVCWEATGRMRPRTTFTLHP